MGGIVVISMVSGFIGNIIWVVIGGWWIALSHLFANISFTPLEKEIVSSEEAGGEISH